MYNGSGDPVLNYWTLYMLTTQQRIGTVRWDLLLRLFAVSQRVRRKAVGMLWSQWATGAHSPQSCSYEIDSRQQASIFGSMSSTWRQSFHPRISLRKLITSLIKSFISDFSRFNFRLIFELVSRETFAEHSWSNKNRM